MAGYMKKMPKSKLAPKPAGQSGMPSGGEEKATAALGKMQGGKKTKKKLPPFLMGK